MTALRRPDEVDDRKPTRTIGSVVHAVDVLQALSEAREPMGVSELARRTGLSKTTVHHLLATLESRRMVMRDPMSARFRLGWGLYELGTTVVHNVDLSRVARPYLDRLAAATEESVLLGILDDDSVLYLDRGEAPQGLRMTANAGRRGPLHATASGKVLLAFAGDQALIDRVLGHPLAGFTKTTIIDSNKLRHELATVRQLGYASCWQEREVGLCSVAVPIRNYTGAVVGSLAVAGPASRLTAQSLPAHLIPLNEARREIEAHMGARPDDGPDG